MYNNYLGVKPNSQTVRRKLRLNCSSIHCKETSALARCVDKMLESFMIGCCEKTNSNVCVHGNCNNCIGQLTVCSGRNS